MHFEIIVAAWVVGFCIEKGLNRIACAIEAAHGITEKGGAA